MFTTPRIAIVIQGPSNYVQEVKNAWKDFKDDLIFSTWEGSEDKYAEGDNVIFNKLTKYSGDWNLNYQKKSSYYGLLKAKELGYTYAIKVRSDYLPTNAKEFIKILKLDKMNFLLWHYTTFLWKDFPTFNGYFTDHLISGPIDYMIELWDIKDNVCSAQTVVTWSYINKLRDKIGVYYYLKDLKRDSNTLFYIKETPDSDIFGFYNYTDIFGRNLKGRYEDMYQTFRRNPDGTSEYTRSEEETKKYMNDNYLNFLKYYNPLYKVTILNKNNKIFNNIIYPKDKLEIVTDENEITGDYVIEAENITSNATIMIEYFKKINCFYTGLNQQYYYNNNEINWANAANYSESGYIDGTESVGQSKLLTKDEFFWNPKNEKIEIDTFEISENNVILSKNNKTITFKCIITTDNIINKKVKINNEYIDIINIIDFIKQKNIKNIKSIKNVDDNISLEIYNYLKKQKNI